METRRIGTKEFLAPMLAHIPIAANSDYYPVLDQNAARTRFLRTNAKNLIELAEAPLPCHAERLRRFAPGKVGAGRLEKLRPRRCRGALRQFFGECPVTNGSS